MNKTVTAIRKAHTVVAFDAATATHVYMHDADVAFDETGIVHVGGNYDGPAANEISGRNRMVMPGLVNVHCHSGDEPVAKGIFDDQGTQALWGNALYEYSALLDIDDTSLEAALTVMVGDLMRSGVTTLLDIAAPHAKWLPTLAKSGARAYVAPGFREAQWRVVDSHRLDFNWDKARGRDAFARALELVDEARAHACGRLGGIVAPSQIETCSPELLIDATQEAHKRGIPITIHAAQTMTEHEELLRRTGLTAVQYMERLGILGPNLIIGHCIFVDSHSWTRQRTDLDLKLLAERKATVAHCPVTFSRSGMTLESVGRYRRNGVNVALGTDSYPFNMLEEMRRALICSRVAGKSVFDIDTAGILEVATLAGAKALGRGDLGRIAKGAKADFSLIDLNHHTMQPVYDPLRNLIHCAAERAVEAVYVDGARVVEGGRPTLLDYDGAVAALKDAQAYCCRKAEANDPQRRKIAALAPKSLPVASGSRVL
ncbi:cytosine/adenosine deaminase-related metal-dependent hydrolase [Pararhizobium capsulatum DSM 1112]|uniref:Cytosine/adenosine deaminase-related metal-dependent hydrolase n=1 Tax=Pararhizobium capsulatum DSM 1112 TaxID=1121113 RepID=A0ABU0BZU0_9HYPH|nr:amidohydrolase family protein [Pararhizobium capsulatum]MDQ0323755.1 cytosine/adenosine deaminase-related metal-dependent hydrolase [Pararhizobium capsulatum DSM 1112]